ncbi:hypothetical protein CROQUDRAFT_48623 [Cronartium quercuum f. sp. fusiforme G11]|uniref:DUF7872 domain-containing protein n=1 Tax=Cronartium quercuum f. sp. fusiforme G11 TaxID=708437 RepID=A0A9P6NG71_9BASI|nr:hypothetical protein CROQUDRAFT_48623 [Cronartium quercuum f. sp. fusiforme G11]
MASTVTTNLERRAGLDFLNGFGGGSQTGTVAAGPNPTAGLKDPCGQIELTADSWNQLQVDQYIANYPNIQNLTLAEFAAELEAPNFFCGIGLSCLAGQICSPAVGINWLILYALQEWNNYMNSLYSAIENAITIMREATAGIVADFMPDEHVDKSIFGYGIATVVIGILSIFTAIAVPVFMPTELTLYSIESFNAVAAPAQSAEELKISYEQAEAAKLAGKPAELASLQTTQDIKSVRKGFFGLVVVSKPKTTPAVPNNSMRLALLKTFGYVPQHPTARLRKRSLSKRALPPSVFSYSRWAFLDTHLTALQNRLQGIVALTSKLGITEPMGSSNGLASVLQGGSFLIPNPVKADLQKAALDLAQITAISEFFKSIGMFVTIASDPCTDSGIDGAWPGDDKLSYCTPQGVMMNIIQANGDKVSNSVKNAKLLSTKYGYTTQWLTQAAWDCQMKYGISPLSIAPPPTSAKSDCVFSLPVCDCTLPDVQHIRSKGHGTVKACREGAHLPI